MSLLIGVFAPHLVTILTFPPIRAPDPWVCPALWARVKVPYLPAHVCWLPLILPHADFASVSPLLDSSN